MASRVDRARSRLLAALDLRPVQRGGADAARAVRSRSPSSIRSPWTPPRRPRPLLRRRARARSPKACGSSARPAMPCSTARSWSATSTFARSAAITCASARATGWRRFLDPDTGVEIGATISPEDPLKFRDSKRYKDRLGPGPEGHRREGRASRARRQGEWPAHRRVRVRVPIPRRFDGLGGRRALQARGRPLRRAQACRSSASPPRAARACRRRCTPSCRWRRPAQRSRASRRRTCRSSR